MVDTTNKIEKTAKSDETTKAAKPVKKATAAKSVKIVTAAKPVKKPTTAEPVKTAAAAKPDEMTKADPTGITDKTVKPVTIAVPARADKVIIKTKKKRLSKGLRTHNRRMKQEASKSSINRR